MLKQPLTCIDKGRIDALVASGFSKLILEVRYRGYMKALFGSDLKVEFRSGSHVIAQNWHKGQFSFMA